MMKFRNRKRESDGKVLRYTLIRWNGT
jgi:hypothetical protein